MKTDEILKNNKLIAEFMGAATKTLIDLREKKVGDKWKTDGTFLIQDLEFHSSWDWLMPVVEKIEKYKQNVRISSIHRHANLKDGLMHMCDISNKDKPMQHIGVTGESKINTVYKAVIAFINWHNKSI